MPTNSPLSVDITKSVQGTTDVTTGQPGPALQLPSYQSTAAASTIGSNNSIGGVTSSTSSSSVPPTNQEMGMARTGGSGAGDGAPPYSNVIPGSTEAGVPPGSLGYNRQNQQNQQQNAVSRVEEKWAWSVVGGGGGM